MFLKVFSSINKGMCYMDAVFNGWLLKEVKNSLHIVIFDASYIGFRLSSLKKFSISAKEHLIIRLFTRLCRSSDAILDIIGQKITRFLWISPLIGSILVYIDDLVDLIRILKIYLHWILHLLQFSLLFLIEQLSPCVHVFEGQTVHNSVMEAVIKY